MIEAEIEHWGACVWEIAQQAEAQQQKGSFMVAVILFIAQNIAALPAAQQAETLGAIGEAVKRGGDWRALQ